MDEVERDRILTEIAYDTAGLLATMRRERERRVQAGEDVVWLDLALKELESLAAGTADLVTFRAIRSFVDRHGAGPYPVEELAAIAGVDVEDVRRVLARMDVEGLATPADRPPPDAPPADR
ncbi:hypothetical protein ACWENQ_16085 [Nonomuraea sp. NPDC004354]